MNLQYALDYCKRVGYRSWAKSPRENRHVVTVDDWAQELSLHLFSKLHVYDSKRSWNRWVHTIIVNKAITLLTNQWDKKFGLGFSLSVKSLVYTNIEGESELITTITPELEMILYQDKLTYNKEISQMAEVTYDRVQELCTRFNQPYDKKTDDTVRESLTGVLGAVLNDMSDEDYNALDEAIRLELAQFGEAVEKGWLTLKKAVVTVKGTGGGKGGGGSKGRGVLKRVRDLFGEGTQTVAEVVTVMDAEGIIFSPASVRAEIGKLRREAGMTRKESVTEVTPKAAAEGKEQSESVTEEVEVAPESVTEEVEAAPESKGTSTAKFTPKPKAKPKGKGKGKGKTKTTK